MIFSLKRVNAIFQKDLKDLSKNMFVGTSLITPLLLAFFYGRMDNLSIEMYYLLINLCLTMVGAYIQCALIAEEKEKNTLRGLMLSPATIPEIIGGKSLVSFILTIVIVLLCLTITNYQPENLILITIAIVISTIFYIALGTLLGLLTKSVIEASVVILPFFFLFSFGTFLKVLIEEYPMLSFIEYMPNIQLVDLANKVQLGAGFVDVWMHLAVILAWLIGMSILVVWVFKKRELDE